jgi:SAM-dependent methyltransferase
VDTSKDQVKEVQAHYETYPYPSYPWYSRGSWKSLRSVDFSAWQVKRGVKDAWIAGCGSIAPLMFGRRNPSVKILATDLSRRSLDICRFRLFLYGIHNLQLKQEDILESSYQSAFDAIDCYGVLHHLPDPKLGLKRLAAALRPEGVLRVMLYSESARAPLEKVREEAKQKGIVDLADVIRLGKDRGLNFSEGDLTTKSGRADALLHPVVSTYSKVKLLELFESVPQLKVREIRELGNYIIFCEKK